MKTADIQVAVDEPVSANLIKVVRHNFKKMQAAEARREASKEERRQMGLADMQVGGTGSKNNRKKTQTEVEAEVEEMLNRPTGE